jgi:translation initiation factor IF-3
LILCFLGSIRKYYKVNQNIKVPEVRVIADGKNLGVMPTQEAMFKARQQGLDLVEVSSKAKPPICKIIDFRKFRYNEQKKDQAGKKKGKTQDVKEVRFTPFIGRGDFESRIKKIKTFLNDDDKVKLTVKFVGRQITRKDFGDRVLNNALQELEDLYKVESEPVLQGKILSMIIKPTGSKPTENKETN